MHKIALRAVIDETRFQQLKAVPIICTGMSAIPEVCVLTEILHFHKRKISYSQKFFNYFKISRIFSSFFFYYKIIG